jgi:hypothetical protein
VTFPAAEAARLAAEPLCTVHSDCSMGSYCDNTGKCWTCDVITPTFCDAIDYDCESDEFVSRCTADPGAPPDYTAHFEPCANCRAACDTYCVDRPWELIPTATVEGTVIGSPTPLHCTDICSTDGAQSLYLSDDVSARASAQCCKYEGGGQRTWYRPSSKTESTVDAICLSKCDERECALYGCTHMYATNYNAKATRDDGSCMFGGECTDLVDTLADGFSGFSEANAEASSDCNTYALNAWCNATGIGPGWQLNFMWGALEDYVAPNGMTPRDACCACGGGRVENRTEALPAARAASLHVASGCEDYEWNYYPWEAHDNHQKALGDSSLELIYEPVDDDGPYGTCNDTDIAVIEMTCESLFSESQTFRPIVLNASRVDGWEKYDMLFDHFSTVALCDGPAKACKEVMINYYPACTTAFNATEPTMEEWRATADGFVNTCGSLVGCDAICASTASSRVHALPSWLSTDVHASNGKGRRADESCCCFGGGTAGCNRCHAQCDDMYGESSVQKDLDACHMQCDNSGVCDFVTDIDPQASCDGVTIDQQWYPTPELRRGASPETRCLAKSDKRRPVQCFFDEDTEECTEISECQICQANVGAEGSGNPVGPLAQSFNLDCACKCGDQTACEHCSIAGCPLDEESPLEGTRQVCAADGLCRGTWQNCWYRCETEDSFLETCARELASLRPEGFDQAQCDVELCKQNCDCQTGRFAAPDVRFDLTEPVGEEVTPWTSKLCRSVCPLVPCRDEDICSEESRQCESQMEAAIEIQLPPTSSVEDLQNDDTFLDSFKTQVGGRLGVEPDAVHINEITAARRRVQQVNANDTHVVHRRLQGGVRIDFAIQVPVAVFAQSVENMNTAAAQNQDLPIATSAGIVQASVGTMRPAVTWEQYTADAQRIVLDTLRDCNEHDKIYIFEGPWDKNSEIFLTIDLGPAMWDDPLCAGPEPPDECNSNSFNDFRTKTYEGATVTLMTCGSTTAAGANLIASATGLTTYSPSYATGRGSTGELEIDVLQALSGIDPYDQTEQARRECVIQSILADEMPDSLRQQVESEICCASGTYTPASLRQRIQAPPDRSDLSAYGRTTVRMECLSDEGCEKLSFDMKCQAGIDCNDPDSVRSLYAVGEWVGDLDSLQAVETSTTSDAKLQVTVKNTGAYDLTVQPPSGTDKPVRKHVLSLHFLQRLPNLSLCVWSRNGLLSTFTRTIAQYRLPPM